MKKFVAIMLAFVLAFTLFACKKDKTEDVAPTGLKITLEETEIAVGDSVTAKAKVSPDNATDKTVKWSSDNDAVATVNSRGVITAVAEGTAKITAVANAASNVKDTVTVTVVAGAEPTPTPTPTPQPTPTPPPTVPTGEVIYVEKIIFLVSGEQHLFVGETAKFGLSYNDADPLRRPTDTTVLYESSDEALATVAENGLITAVGAGTVTITVIANGAAPGAEVKDSVTLIIEDVVPPTSFNARLNTPDSIKPGVSASVVIECEPANADKRATFESSDESIATVDENGTITTFSGVEGTCQITVTSVAKPEFVVVLNVVVAEQVIITTPESIAITGPQQMYVGEAYSVRLTASVLPATADQRVVWRSNNDAVATVDQDGLVTGHTTGTARIRATSVADPEVESAWFTIKISEYVPQEAVDLKGYEIVFMNADSALADIDPFLEKYSQPDKEYKQQAWREVESEYNCTIVVKPYPAEAPWGDVRVKWIIDNATNNTSQCDLGTISSDWIARFAAANAAVDVSAFYEKYGESQMEQVIIECGSFNQKLYVASTGIDPTAVNIDYGLFYNMALLEKNNLPNPAKMFNDGEWTYTNFQEWVRQAQAALGAESGQYALAGHPYYWWRGFTEAAGIKVVDTTTVKIYLSTDVQKEASTMYRTLFTEGCIDPVGSWCESNSDNNAWFSGNAIMTTGSLWFVRNASRWTSTMWGEDTRFGYVPFPYPDTQDKESVRVGKGGLSLYLYCAGRQYPAGVSTEGVYRAVSEMFLRTIRLRKADPLFDADEVVTNELQKRIDDPESIDAIKFFTASKVFADPLHAPYTSISATDLKTPCVQYMYAQVETYDEVFDAVYNTYYNKILAIFGA